MVNGLVSYETTTLFGHVGSRTSKNLSAPKSYIHIQVLSCFIRLVAIWLCKDYMQGETVLLGLSLHCKSSLVWREPWVTLYVVHFACSWCSSDAEYYSLVGEYYKPMLHFPGSARHRRRRHDKTGKAETESVQVRSPGTGGYQGT